VLFCRNAYLKTEGEKPWTLNYVFYLFLTEYRSNLLRSVIGYKH